MNTSLGCLFEDLTAAKSAKYKPPDFDVESGCKSYMLGAKGQAHDAGFDAFMTGVCFIVMLKHLGECVSSKVTKASLMSP